MNQSHFKDQDTVKLFVEFIAQYVAMIEGQVAGIKQEMAQIVDEVMDSVSGISNAQDQKKKMAESILMKFQDVNQTAQEDQAVAKDQFQEVSAATQSKKEQAMVSTQDESMKRKITSNIRHAGGQLKAHMKSLESLDSEMKNLIFTMVGAMSADDVVGQRLDHVSHGLKLLRDGLIKAIENFDETFQPLPIQELGKEINSKLYKSYTMGDERKAFISVHGKEPDSTE